MSSKIRICVIAFSLMFASTTALSSAADKELRFPLPNLLPLTTQDQCKCEAVVSAGLYANTIQNKGISGELSKGIDKISVRIEGNILHFLSGASFETGEAKTAQFQIIHNSDEHVSGILTQKTAFGLTVDIFTLNKKTGMSVWTKTRSSDMLAGGTPSAQSFYLKCK